MGSSGATTGAWRRTLAATLLSSAVTGMVFVVPAVRFAYRSPEGRLLIETVAACVAALTALLFYGRYRRSRSLQALLLVHALAVLSVAAFGLMVLPMVGGVSTDSAVSTWAPLVVRLVGALLLVSAALAAHRKVGPGASLLRELLIGFALLLGVVITVQLLAAGLPAAVAAFPSPEESTAPRLAGHPLVLAVQAVVLVCYALASVAFTRQAARSGDELSSWIGAAAGVGAVARLNYLIYPSLYSDWLYIGDLLRLAFYVLLLVGAVREVQAYWVAQATVAVFEERRRLARDLHDGALQEIGFIRNEARNLHGEAAARVASAAERALDETRAAVAATAAPPGELLASALRRSVTEVADRYGVHIRWDLTDDGKVDDERRDDLLRIAREAVINAARHGRASTVVLRLRDGELMVRDNGLGFDPGAPRRPGAFGLISMTERAEGIGGRLEVRSEPGGGTEVRAWW